MDPALRGTWNGTYEQGAVSLTIFSTEPPLDFFLYDFHGLVSFSLTGPSQNSTYKIGGDGPPTAFKGALFSQATVSTLQTFFAGRINADGSMTFVWDALSFSSDPALKTGGEVVLRRQ